MNNTTLEQQKAQQLEKLIAKIETRFSGKFITEEQWKFVLDRLTALEKQISKEPSRRKGSLLDQVMAVLDDYPKGLFIREIAENLNRKPSAIRSIMYILTNSQAVQAESTWHETQTKEKRYFLTKYGTNRE